MQTEAETILKMSETLESAKFTRDQSDAFIQSMALAMKSFAVTPEVLDDRMEKLRREWKQDLVEVNKRLDDLQDLVRSLLRYFLNFTLAMLVGALGMLGAFLFS